MNPKIKKDWESFKKWATWDQIKALISGALSLAGFFYLDIQWMNLVSPILNKHTNSINTPITPEQTVISLCLLFGFIGPLFLAFPILQFGLWLGKATKFYKDDRTRYIYFDDVSYLVADMPQDQREKIKEILASYKSKAQLRKEGLANKSWFRRNFL